VEPGLNANTWDTVGELVNKVSGRGFHQIEDRKKIKSLTKGISQWVKAPVCVCVCVCVCVRARHTQIKKSFLFF
jgi:hypothetical protein